MYDATPIRADRAAGLTISEIARRRGMARDTVRAALSPDRADRYRRPTLADEWGPQIREVLERYPFMPAVDVHHKLQYPGPLRQFSTHVHTIRREVHHGASHLPGRRPQGHLG